MDADRDRPAGGDAGTDVPVQHQEETEQGDAAVAQQPATAAQPPPPKPFDIFEFVKNIKCPPLQKDVISEFDEAAASNPHQILRGIFTFLRAEGVSEGDKVLVLNMAHELLFAYFDEHVDPLGEAEQQMALDALKLVYVDEATSVSVRRELNNVVSLIWKLSEEIDIEQSPNQVANLGQLLRYCLNPAAHTAASTQADRHLLAELGLTLFSRIMHEILLPYLLSHEEGEDDEDGPAHYVEKALFPHLSSTITDATAPLSLRVAAMMVITTAFNSELPSCINGFITLNTFLPHIVQALSDLCNAGDYEKLEELLRSFDHLSLPFVVPHIPIYVQTLMALATATFVPGRLRSVALQPLISLSTKHAAVLTKEGNFLRFLVWHLMYLFLLAEPRKEEVEERDASADGIVYEDDGADEEEDEHHGKDSPSAVAGWALSAIVKAFGHETIMPVCMSYIGQYFMCGHEWRYPHASLRALAALMKAYGRVAAPTRFDPLVYTVVHYYQHPNISLRVAAAVCLGRMAKYVPQFSRKFSSLVMPVFNDRLKDSSVSVLITTCRALTYFFQNKSKGEGFVPRGDEFEDENDDAHVDAEDEEEPDETMIHHPGLPVVPELQHLEELVDNLSQKERETEQALESEEAAPPQPSSPEEDQWSDRLLEGLTELVKDGSGKVKEHAVTTLFNITQLSDSALQQHLPRLVALCLGMLNQRVAYDLEERTNLRTIGRVLRCTTQVGTLAGKEKFQADALKFIDALVNRNDTVERLLDTTPAYVASALGRIASCLGMDFAPYLGLFLNVVEECIPHQCDNVLLMTEDRPVDMDGWEVAETVDDFGGVQKVYVYKREIRDKRIAINALGSVITIFADSDEGAQHFFPYIKRAQYMMQRVLRLVDNNFEVMGVKELSFSRHIPALIRVFNRVKSADKQKSEEAKFSTLKPTLSGFTRAARVLLPTKSQSFAADDDDADYFDDLLETPPRIPPLPEQLPQREAQSEEPAKTADDRDKGKEKLTDTKPLETANEEGEKSEGNDGEAAVEPPEEPLGLSNLIEPLWQDLANAWEMVQEPKKSMELFALWEEMLSTAKGECLSVAEVHATAEHLLSVLYDSDHYMDFEGEEVGEGASFLAGNLIPEVMEGLMQYHPAAFDGTFMMNHIIPSLQNVLQDTPFPATQQGCLLMLDSVLDFMPRPHDYVNTIGPLLFRFVLHPDPAISQAACYGLGVCAKLTSPEADKDTSDALCQNFAALQQATVKWHARAQRSREEAGNPKTPEQWVCDNTLSAQAKVFCRHYYNMPNLTGAIDAWLEYLPLRADTVEMVEILEILCGFIRSPNPQVRMFIASRRKTVARALVEQLSKFNRMVKLADHIERLEPLLPFIGQYVQENLADDDEPS